ncbi:MAG: PepSY domain-containing protein [Parvibaculaceae bacterium]
MKTALAAIALTLAAVTPALADDDMRCTSEPRASWMSVDQAKAAAAGHGYDAYKIEADDGCYEIDARDKSGKKVDILLHPISGAIVHVEDDD